MPSGLRELPPSPLVMPAALAFTTARAGRRLPLVDTSSVAGWGRRGGSPRRLGTDLLAHAPFEAHRFGAVLLSLPRPSELPPPSDDGPSRGTMRLAWADLRSHAGAGVRSPHFPRVTPRSPRRAWPASRRHAAGSSPPPERSGTYESIELSQIVPDARNPRCSPAPRVVGDTPESQGSPTLAPRSGWSVAGCVYAWLMGSRCRSGVQGHIPTPTRAAPRTPARSSPPPPRPDRAARAGTSRARGRPGPIPRAPPAPLAAPLARSARRPASTAA